MIRATLPAADLGRVLANALAFVPLRGNTVSTVALSFCRDRVIATGTDGYAAGQDWAAPTDFRGDPGMDARQPILIARDDAAEIEQFCRIDPDREMPATEKRAAKLGGPRKTGEGLDLAVCEDGTIEVAAGETLKSYLIVDLDHDRRIYGALADLLDPLRELHAPARYPKGPLMLDPQRFGRFAKVKADGSGRMADLLLTADPGPDGEVRGPVLVKIGPTFRGLIQPVDRTVNAANVGQDGLW